MRDTKFFGTNFTTNRNVLGLNSNNYRIISFKKTLKSIYIDQKQDSDDGHTKLDVLVSKIICNSAVVELMNPLYLWQSSIPTYLKEKFI